MARYNTIVASTSLSAGTTLGSPGSGIFNEITTGGITVQLPNPALYAGSSQIFYNSTASTATLSTTINGGTIQGPGLANTNSLTLNANGALTLYSDGTYWIQTNAAGQPLAVSTLSASGQITSTWTSGTAPFVVASTTNVANLNASSLNGATFSNPGSIGAGTAAAGAFTTLSASSTVSGTGFSTYLASPPAIGGTAANTGAFTSVTLASSSGTTLSVSSTAQGSSAASGNAVQVTGGLGVGGTIYTVGLVETSSIAFKENVNPIVGALEAILKLTGVTYDRKDNKSHEAGLIAEHVYKHAPDLVALDEHGKPYGIHYTKISAYLIECIKSLQLEINELKGTKILKGTE